MKTELKSLLEEYADVCNTRKEIIMDNKLAEKLLKMKSVVDKADTAKSRAEGALSAIMQDLEKRDKIKINDIKKATCFFIVFILPHCFF